ncbi:MAG TPA: 2-alkenal reductase, partial [Myxococcaceae bacterium]|nr:2-alkenal reductase [Myxococcaceae bacterium]
KEPGAEFIEVDIFQGDSELVVDNEYLGTLRVKATSAGKKIDFRLTEECLLRVTVEGASGLEQVELATKDTPESLKKALEADNARRQTAAEPAPAEEPKAPSGGIFSSLKRILGRG